ncbi:hypothetical protein F6X86_07945 [Enterococcus durans]|uniref:Uncharacterized protein n=1 Tax=Enterococcus durans TaxID=53345 RepID=A0A5N0YU33_9ENTE|nr:hypothetical protein F6X86_07945 [Enterococcus durans]TKN20152.1 hypothetical protein DVW83_02455 [Enterococcus sp. VV15]KAA9185898.1 hypothetical protein F6X85_07340 [Enterococcus durans]KAA9186291.1 hypothetical protein F6X90_06800 [Enterococcus durans]KAA9191101.1 hypothetical protein F6Y12_07225 [Enterococcus durans]
MDFGLFLGVASAPTVYSFLKNETKAFLTFVPRSFFEISEKPDFWTSFIRESVANLIVRFVPHSTLLIRTE